MEIFSCVLQALASHLTFQFKIKTQELFISHYRNAKKIDHNNNQQLRPYFLLSKNNVKEDNLFRETIFDIVMTRKQSNGFYYSH